MKSHHNFLSIAFVVIIVFFSACRKDISLSDPTLSKLFGNWEWVQTSGGFAGKVKTPATEGYFQSVEFKSDGIYKLYTDGQQKDKKTFTLSEGISILTNASAWLIQYKDNGVGNNSENTLAQSIRFGGQDTLFLTDEAFDGNNYIYVRKQ